MRTGENGKKASKPLSRDERLKAALRENLHRRKAQERARGAAGDPESRPKACPAPQEDKNR